MYDADELFDILDNHLEEQTEYAYITTHIEQLPKLIAAYDLACWRCYPNEVVEKIRNSILSVQKHLVPYLKKCFREDTFDFEIDYLMSILYGLSSESIKEMEDELIMVSQNEEWHNGYGDLSFDILKLILKHDPSKKTFFAPLLGGRLEKANKKRADLQSKYPKKFIEMDDYREEQTRKFFPKGFSSFEENLKFNRQVTYEWMEGYGNDKLIINELKDTNEYINEICDLLNMDEDKS